MIEQAHQSLVAVPSWVIGVVGSAFVLLFAVIGWLLVFVVMGFKESNRATQEAISQLSSGLSDGLKAVSEALAAFKVEVFKEFVTHPFLDEVQKGNIQRAAEVSRQLKTHKEECPARNPLR